MVCAARSGAGAKSDHFAAVLLLQLQRGFERVSVRLVDLVSEIGLFDPLARRSDPQLRIARGHLLDGNDDFHVLGRDACAGREACATLRHELLKHQSPVGSAEPETVGEGVFDLHRPRVVRHVIQIAHRIRARPN